MKPFSKYLFALSLFFLRYNGNAQVKSLTINDAVTDLQFHNIYNAPFQSVSLSRFKNKIVILDFWGTHCGTCIAKMFTLSQLQKKFASDIQIIMVTPDSRKKVIDFFSKRPRLKNLGLPTVTGEKELLKLFPFAAVPHTVWIGKDRQIKAITGGDELTEENIEELIKKNSIALPLKQDFIEFRSQKPLLAYPDFVLRHTIVSSTLTGEIKGISGRGTSIIDSRTKIHALNNRLIDLYAFAYINKITIPFFDEQSRIKIDSSKKSLSENNGDVLYCYELLLPFKGDKKTNFNYSHNYMQQDLDRLFGIKSSIQNKRVPCYIFSQQERTIGTQDNEGSQIIDEGDSTEYKNVLPDAILTHLQIAYSFELPVIRETSSKERINITLPNHFSTIDEVRLVLSQIGYRIKKEERQIEMLMLE